MGGIGRYGRCSGLSVRGLLIVLMLAPAPAIAQLPDGLASYDASALLGDFDHLVRKLRVMHPALWMYSTPQRFDACVDSLRQSLHRSGNELDLLNAAAALYPLLGDGHTLFLPSPTVAERTKVYLPLQPYWYNGRLFVLANGSNDDGLLPGYEIISINGVPAASIMDTLMRRQVRDGHNLTYPVWILNNWFKEYYRFSFGEPTSFDILIRGPGGEARITAAALPRDSIRANTERREPPHRKGVEPTFGLGFADDSVGVLTIPSFERGSFTVRQLDQVFEDLDARRVQRLIIDVRGNQGGDPKLARRLLAHLLPERFNLVQTGPASGFTRPRPRTFDGEVVVLMDGGSFSVTGMVLACLERNGRAAFVGEEAGGNRTALSGSPKRIVLLNTGLQCYISTRLWLLADGGNNGHGVRPTVAVPPALDDLLDGRDVVMLAALDLLL